MVLTALRKSQPSRTWRGVDGSNLPMFRRNQLSVLSGRRINLHPEDGRITLFLKPGKLLPHNKASGNDATPHPITSDTPVSKVGGELPPAFGAHSDMKYVSPRGT